MATKRKPFTPRVGTLDEQLSGVREAESIDAAEVLTVNGKPIPPEFAHAITYAMTDQGIAEEAARPVKRATPGVAVVSDAWDKTLERKAEAPVWDSFDPLREAVDRVREPGMAYRFISPNVEKRRGGRGWEKVADKDGKAVTVAGQILGKMPLEQADKRGAHYRGLANEALQHAAEQFQTDQAKLIRDSGVSGMSPLLVGDVINDNHSHPGMRTEVGVRTQRGERAA